MLDLLKSSIFIQYFISENFKKVKLQKSQNPAFLSRIQQFQFQKNKIKMLDFVLHSFFSSCESSTLSSNYFNRSFGPKYEIENSLKKNTNMKTIFSDFGENLIWKLYSWKLYMFTYLPSPYCLLIENPGATPAYFTAIYNRTVIPDIYLKPRDHY